MKELLKVDLQYVKSTKGTHVLANVVEGMTIYVPRRFFDAAGVRPEGKFQLVVTVTDTAGGKE